MTKRPASFEFAMDFLGDPEASELRAYIERFESLARQLTEWRHCMSYNQSYFGEPAGLLKQIAAEFDRMLPRHGLVAAPMEKKP